MRFLRTVPTRRLVALLSGLVIAAGGGTAIALAAAGGGPVPRAKKLAAAIHQALAAKGVAGVSADITFTNNLISSSDLQGSDPLLTGGQGRLWITRERGRIELQSDNGDAEIVWGAGRLWAYDPSSNVVYRFKLPAPRASRPEKADRVPSVVQIQKALNRFAAHLRISGAAPTDVAGQPAYRTGVAPRQNGGLLSAVQLAWDASRGVPLDFAVFAKGNPSPVLELQATGITYGRVPLSDFRISPPTGAHVVNVSLPATPARHGAKRHHQITGPSAVRKHLSFTLAAPGALAGMNRHSVSLVGGHGALVTYGRGLGALVVIERPAKPGSSVLPTSSAGGDGGSGLTLPTISVGGVTAQELVTPLGTVVQFTRGGVSYVILGSVTSSVAKAAARGL
jgi:hypothetical protein